MGCSIMSELKVDTIVNLAGTGKPNLPVAPSLGGAALASANTYIYTSSGTEPRTVLKMVIYGGTVPKKRLCFT